MRGGIPGKTWDEVIQGNLTVLNIQHDMSQEIKMEACYQVNTSNSC